MRCILKKHLKNIRSRRDEERGHHTLNKKTSRDPHLTTSQENTKNKEAIVQIPQERLLSFEHRMINLKANRGWPLRYTPKHAQTFFM